MKTINSSLRKIRSQFNRKMLYKKIFLNNLIILIPHKNLLSILNIQKIQRSIRIKNSIHNILSIMKLMKILKI